MADMDVFAAMGIAGFGKKVKQRQLDPKRFEKNKRGDTVRQTFCLPQDHMLTFSGRELLHLLLYT